MSEPRPRQVVALLAGQAFAFGLGESLLLITANAIFLDAYGSKWLPLTYIAIAVVGTLLAAGVARMLRRWPLPRVALAAESAVAVLFLGAWAVLAAGGVWVSAPLLVLFPVLLQIGFIFVGGQAGRLLDLQQIKQSFPRVVAGFTAGFLAGGLVGTRLLSVLGATDRLLLVAVAAEIAFVVLLAVPARRFSERLGHVERSAIAVPRPPIRRLLTTSFVLLIIGYQVLSAAGTQLVEYLVFDRAAARYQSATDLADFLSRYTVVLNLIDMLFLALVAGLLLRRFGLRLGIAANPVAVTALVIAMLVTSAVWGEASLALFVLVATARIVDISLTDGTTRTSINTAYQVLPGEERLTVQSTVEGVGVPVAVGATGVLLFALRALNVSVTVIVGVTVVVCLVWALAGLFLYSEYARSIVAAFRRRLLPDVPLDLAGEQAAAALQRLVASDDGRDVRLGLDLLAGSTLPTERTELIRLAGDARAEVRVPALVRLSGDGVGDAPTRLGAEIATLATSGDAREREIAAQALAASVAGDRRPLAALVRDPDPTVRAAALAAVAPGDESLVGAVLDALGQPATIGPAAAAIGRLGDAALPALQAALEEASRPVPVPALRLVRALRPASPELAAAGLGRYIEHPDRDLGLAVLSALAATGGAGSSLSATIDRTLQTDAEHAARCLAALAVVEPAPILERALRDELVLLRHRVLALLAVRHGAEVIGPAALGLAGGDESRRALAIEMLDVTLSREEAAYAVPVVRTDLPEAERRLLLEQVVPVPAADRAHVLVEIAEDREDRWRASWLQACALYEAISGDSHPLPDVDTRVADRALLETIDWAAGRTSLTKAGGPD
ncbi:MAG: hypothetical protein ACM3QU_12270 [Verrucomicrobiota bacterium]